MVLQVKQELAEQNLGSRAVVGGTLPPESQSVIELSSSSSDSGDRSGRGDDAVSSKKARASGDAISGGSSRGMKRGALLPPGFLEPLPAADAPAMPPLPLTPPPLKPEIALSNFKQFWKAGDYVGASPAGDWDSYTGGMDHVRVHPKFLHSNATSHKWALGAFAELLDNALDEVCNGATYVNIDMLTNKKDGSRMLLIEDNGGGMTPDKMRQCMSLGYSAKSKVANTIGQYGNGFKTSTMRLGADVIVFSRCPTNDGKGHTQSIGLLSYTFLRSTGKEDIVVPILDYERKGGEWNKIIRSSAEDWSINVETIVQWSPFASEAQLLQQFYLMKNHGTRIIIYNLWEDDQGQLEMDFDSDPHDIQIRGVNRDEKNVKMAKEFPNSKHYLTYRHSLRSYVSILYLRLPPSFRIILRGKDVGHHNIVNDMMLTQEVTYRPQASVDGISRDPNMIAVVTIGFVKDAKAHIDVQGFNVYHKNRLIKPFWRVWNPSGSDGRGVLGLLEANFIEPAHDKQGFERTTVLARLEAKLMSMQRTFWTTYCHKIGYAPRRIRNDMKSPTRETSPEYVTDAPSRSKRRASDYDKSYSPSYHKQGEKAPKRHTYENGTANGRTESRTKFGRSSLEEPSSTAEASTGDDRQARSRANGSAYQTFRACGEDQVALLPAPVACAGSHQGLESEGPIHVNSCSPQVLAQLTEENRLLKERLEKREEDVLGELVSDLQDERSKRSVLENKVELQKVGISQGLSSASLEPGVSSATTSLSFETGLKEAESKIQKLNREQEKLIDIYSEERDKRDVEEERLRKELKQKSTTIQELTAKVKLLESLKPPGWK